jgi:hypothetical protein
MMTTRFTKIGGGGGTGFGGVGFFATTGGASCAGGGGVPRHPIAAITTHAQRFTDRE